MQNDQYTNDPNVYFDTTSNVNSAIAGNYGIVFPPCAVVARNLVCTGVLYLDNAAGSNIGCEQYLSKPQTAVNLTVVWAPWGIEFGLFGSFLIALKESF